MSTERSRALDGMRVALDAVPPMSAETLDEVLDRALSRSDLELSTHGLTAKLPRLAPGPVPFWRRPVLAFGLTGLAVAAALLLVVMRPRLSPGPGPSAPLAGVGVAPAGRSLQALLQAGEPVQATGPVQLTLGPAALSLESGAAVQVEARRLRIRAGAVEVTVPAGGLVVQARSFAVEAVDGARFRVEVDSVRVESGAVRIVGPDGGTRVAALGAGQSYPPPAPPAAPAAEPAPAAPAPPVEATPEPAPRARVAGLLAAARRSLARREVARARRQARQALASRPDRREQAEARTLLAESALVLGQRGPAIQQYLAIFQRYPTLAAGENALFAAARLEVQAGRQRAARRHLEQYRKRYPKGRFADEVAERLKQKP